MKFEIEHPEFQTQRLEVETPWIFRSPKLLVNGLVATKNKGNYLINSDSGVEIPIKFKRNFFDPIPKIKIGNETIKLARSFTGLEYLWFVILIFIMMAPEQAHPFGGLVGVLAAVLSAWVFRSKYSLLAKCGLVALITVSAFVALAMLIASLHLLTGAPPNKESIEFELQKASKDINSKLPQVIDSETRLDSTSAQSKSLLYNITLTNLEASDISEKELRGAMEENLAGNICSDKKMRIFIQNAVTISFAYHDKKGKQIAVISVDPSKCKAN